MMLVRRARSIDVDPVRHGRRVRVLHLVLGIATPVILLGFWQLASDQAWINARLYPSPTEIFQMIWKMFNERNFGDDVLRTTNRMLWGYFWGCLFGMLFAYVLGMSTLARAALEPMLNALYTVPKIALLSVFIFVFGLGDKPVVRIISVTVFFFVWVPLQAAVMSVSLSHIEAADSFGANTWQRFRHVILPATLPDLFLSLRVAASVSVLTVIGVEFAFAPDYQGVGYVINNSRQTLEITPAYAGILVAALMGVIFQGVVKLVGRLVLRWPQNR
jgi:sulfonate transport system permease protein